MLFAFQFQSPGTDLLHIGPIEIRWYGFLIAMAVILGVNLAEYLAKLRNVNPELLGDLSIWLVIGAIPCARLYYVLFQWRDYVQHPQDIIAIWKGGIAIHGAIIGGTIALIIFAKLQKTSIWQLSDLVVPSLALGQAIGRWGNFFNSEAFGNPTNLPWKLFIPRERRPLQYMEYDFFHPTFLYESIWNLAIFGILLALFFWGLKNQGKLKTGTITFFYLIIYSLGRFWIEGLRTDSLMLGSLKIAQVVSLIILPLGILGLLQLYVFKRRLPDITINNSEH